MIFKTATEAIVVAVVCENVTGLDKKFHNAILTSEYLRIVTYSYILASYRSSYLDSYIQLTACSGA